MPTIHQDRVVFVSEDDLWQVSVKGGIATRLTSNLGEVSSPHYSDDGEAIAFTGREEGSPEVYVMYSQGGPATRLTHIGSMSIVVGWHKSTIIFACNKGQPFPGIMELYTVDPKTGDVEMLPSGHAHTISFGKVGAIISRNTIGDTARWKRYRGGRTGKFWIDTEGKGKHTKLSLEGNLASPMWVGDNIYFISDSNGFGNLYSCTIAGKNVTQLTDHRNYYVRNASTDGDNIVYQNGADIYCYGINSGKSSKVNIRTNSPRTQLQRKFVPASRYIDDYELSPDGSKLAITTRGKAFTFGNWEGAISQHGDRNNARYRLPAWTNDDNTMILSSDESGNDQLEIHTIDGSKKPQVLPSKLLGRPQLIKVSPNGEYVALLNHRHELVLIKIKSKRGVVIDQSKFGFMEGFNWSADGAWIVYAKYSGLDQSHIRLYSVKSKESYQITETVHTDSDPVFDPEGKYVYFLSARTFNPVYDAMQFELSFPRGTKPYLIALRKDVQSPFVPESKGFGMKPENGIEDMKGKKDKKGPDPVEIDLDGIKDRVIAFPVSEGIYAQIEASKGKVFYSVSTIMGSLNQEWPQVVPPPRSVIKVYDFEKKEEGVFASAVSDFIISQNGGALAYRSGTKIRVIDTMRDSKQELSKEPATNRKTGWIDLSRLKVSIDPTSEWKQMYAEAWRLQRDYYWTENMSFIDWKTVYDRYYPLLDRVASRSEFSDVMWEMQGELGTSHAYEMGGDYRPGPNYGIGKLGAELSPSKDGKYFTFSRIAAGDVWEKQAPPLKRLGVNIVKGMRLLKVAGQTVNSDNHPNEVLANQASQEVTLEIAESNGKLKRTVTIKTINNDTTLWYREWVESNRKYVHEKSNGKLGYVFIPDMGPRGFAEFHRYFLAEFEHEGLVIDLRYNGGGHVSPLLLEKLSRKRFGYYSTRWMGKQPKPGESPRGPMVAITNEFAGSDGDIFSHGFKMLKLGKLIGTRTWGGVIGIWPRNALVDGTITTQPEFSNWFFDKEYGVENYGTDPDIVVEITPQEYVAGKDPQLDRGISEGLKDIKKRNIKPPSLSKNMPNLTLPK